MDARTLLQEFKWLPEDEQQAFYDLVRKTLFPEKYDVQSLTPSQREARYPNKIRCPHCNAIKEPTKAVSAICVRATAAVGHLMIIQAVLSTALR